MKLIMRSEYDNLRLNQAHQCESDTNGDKQVVKIYCNEKLIAKRVKHKKTTRYFGIPEYQEYISDPD